MTSRTIRTLFSRIEQLADASVSSAGAGRAFKSGTAAPSSTLASDGASLARGMLRGYQQPHARSDWLPAPGTHVQSLCQPMHHVRPPFSAGPRDSTPRFTVGSNGPIPALHRQRAAGGRLMEQQRVIAALPVGGAARCAIGANTFAGLGFRGCAGFSALPRRGLEPLSSSSDGRQGSHRSFADPFVGPAARRSFGVLRRRQPDDDER